jgi:hypothetical protein
MKKEDPLIWSIHQVVSTDEILRLIPEINFYVCIHSSGKSSTFNRNESVIFIRFHGYIILTILIKESIMRKITIFCIIVILASFFGCQQPQNTTPVHDGAAITTEEKAKLDALKPEVDRILSEVFGDSVEPNGTRKIKSLEQVSILNERVTKLLKENFGDDYQKFITENELTPTSVTKSPEQSASSDRISESNPIQKSVSGSNNTIIGAEEYSGQNYITTPYLKVSVNTTQTVWYSYNYAIQNIFIVKLTGFYDRINNRYYYNKSTAEYPVSYQTIGIIDQGITNEAYNSNASGWYVTGVLSPAGIPTSSSVITYHYVADPRVFNGSVWYSFQWGK